MKWKAKPIPYNGRIRTKEVFAWFPVRCSDSQWRWLEKVIRIQEFVSSWGDSGWNTVRFDPIEGKHSDT